MRKDVQIAIELIEKELKKRLTLRYLWEQEYKIYPEDFLEDALRSLNEDIKAMERTKFILSST